VIQRPNNFQTLVARNWNVSRTQAIQDPSQADRKCYACGERGIYANQCPNPRTRPPQIAASTPVATRGANYVPVATNQSYARGRVNHVVVGEA
jgi:hypothetical protein